MFDSWIFYVCLFVISQIVFLQTFKYVTKQSKSIGALTVLIQIISAVTAALMILLLLPFSSKEPSFGWKWPSGSDAWLPWLLLCISFIMFAVNDRLDATARKNMDITVDTMLHQSYRILFLPMLILVLGATFAWASFIGGLVIILMNMWLIFDKGKFQFNKYVLLKLVSVLFFTAAMTLQLKSLGDGDFNLPFFVVMSFGVPALVLSGFKQATPKTLYQEVKRKEWWIFLICGAAQALMTFSMYMYMMLGWRTGDAFNAHALSAVYVILNVIFAYIFLKERSNLVKKSIAAVVIVACLVLIALKPF